MGMKHGGEQNDSQMGQSRQIEAQKKAHCEPGEASTDNVSIRLLFWVAEGATSGNGKAHCVESLDSSEA